MQRKENLIKRLHLLERKVLPFLKEDIYVEELIQFTGLQEVEVIRALQWLENKELIKIETILKEIISLDENGETYLKIGLPEKRFLKALTKDTKLDDLKSRLNLSKDEVSVCLGSLKKKVAIEIKPGMVISLTDYGKELASSEILEEKFLKKLPADKSKLTDEERFAYGELTKRKDIIKTTLIKEKKVHLTKEIRGIQKVDLSKVERFYDVKANVPKIYPGKMHFVNEAKRYIKQIWLEMGFKEMSGNMVQTAFWVLDSLFVPQDHPAREMQDTFYIKEPKYGSLPKELVEKIKKVHENGGDTGSKGWGYNWGSEEAQKNILRTHTTGLSSKTISSLNKNDLPAKFFIVGSVFRNETLDAGHLFEFNQIEGIVIDPNSNFRNLLAYLQEFFKKMGLKVRIRPAHFPYTEPSCEVDFYDEKSRKWTEFAGAGIFRPEVVKPLLGIDIPVLAWGLGLERIIKRYYNTKDIRSLYENDINQLKRIKKFLK